MLIEFIQGMRHTKKTVKGLIIPAAWDDNGLVTGLKILGYDEDQFEIADNPAGKQLMDHIREKATVTGKISEAGLTKKIQVDSYFIHNDQLI